MKTHHLKFTEESTVSEIKEGILNETKTSSSGFPHTCKKCGYAQADVTELGASYSDEADKFLFTCKKCGFTERQHDGSGN